MNNNPPTAQIIDFDNYDPFGANDMLPGGMHGANEVNPFNTAGNNNNNINNNNNPNRTGLNNNPAYTNDLSTTTTPGQTTFSPTGSDPNRLYGSGSQSEKSASIFSINYYMMYFNVQGDQVLQRAFASLYPQKGHLEQNIGASPDLYGPVWVAVSLIVSSAISHGIAQFVQNAPNCVAVDTDMRRTSFVASAVFIYAFLLPSALWAFLKYQGVEQRQTLPSYMCLYGYSMAIFIPVSIIWVIRMPVIAWPIMFGATVITGYSLVLSLWPSLQGLSSMQERLAVAAVVLVFHLSLAVSLGAYAFEPSVIDAVPIVAQSAEISAKAPGVTGSAG
ncbi:protein YIPF1-like [Tropilaelaps mercedesae]|uniref:Protein YIPF n=1 Tax=Tropilaelaps mercedesae TaxID=418985 RepID=A0A1V9XDE5_9ACAR|nr:protein YIPF1-like [Tropilaelaps mercedesae]